MVDVIGSIVISLSRRCLPNDEGPGPPKYFFLEPPLIRRRRYVFPYVIYVSLNVENTRLEKADLKLP